MCWLIFETTLQITPVKLHACVSVALCNETTHSKRFGYDMSVYSLFFCCCCLFVTSYNKNRQNTTNVLYAGYRLNAYFNNTFKDYIRLSSINVALTPMFTSINVFISIKIISISVIDFYRCYYANCTTAYKFFFLTSLQSIRTHFPQ